MARSSRWLACLFTVFALACGRQDTEGLPGASDGLDAALVDLGEDVPAPRDADSGPDDAGFEPRDIGDSFDIGGGPGDTPLFDSGETTLPDTGTSTEADSGVLPPDDGGVVEPGDGGPADGAVPADSGVAACTTDQDCGRGGGFISFCDVATGQCVECLNDMQCGRGRICDEQNGNVCRFVCFNGSCGRNGVCDPAINACVDCLASTDCDNGEVCDLSDRTCVECLSDNDCAGSPSAPRCNTASNTCVGCTGDAECGAGRICEPNAQQCVSTGPRGLCEPCDDDALCGGTSDLCIGRLSTSGFVDRSCAMDCTNSTCPAGYDCVTVRQTERQCRPGYAMQQPTCTALRNLGAPCVYDPNATDQGCGIDGLQDARCILDTATGSGVCTVACGGAQDCPTGFTCTGGAGMTGVCL